MVSEFVVFSRRELLTSWAGDGEQEMVTICVGCAIAIQSLYLSVKKKKKKFEVLYILQTY